MKWFLDLAAFHGGVLIEQQKILIALAPLKTKQKNWFVKCPIKSVNLHYFS